MLRCRTPLSKRHFFPGYKTPGMERAISLRQNVLKRRKSLVWGFVNIIFLGAFLYDLSFKCPLYTTWFNYVEYTAVTVFTLNSIYHFFRYIYFTIKTEAIREINHSEKNIDKDQDKKYKTENNDRNNKSKTPTSLNTSMDNSYQCSPTPINWSAASWGNANNSQKTPNNSQNFSMNSPGWVYYRGSPPQKSSANSTPKKIQFPDTSGVEFITDEKTLHTYLSDYDHYEKALNASNPADQSTNILSSFWTHPVTQNPNEISPFLRKVKYQLASQTSTPIQQTGKPDETRTSLNISSLGNEVWRKLQIDPQTLTQWNANLRMWISQTILDRLVCEINAVNEEFNKFHLTDVRIGNVGLERLRKTAQTMPVIQYIPTLTTLLPFLEVSPNQEYLVKRLKELAKGGCMSEFKWSSGGTYNGKDWDESLVNDSEIIIHLLSTYLDCQLVPLPNQPDAKPFSKEHFIRPSEKVPHSPLTLAIHQVTEKPPHFRLIVGEEVFEVSKGHNNLFYTILLFLYFVNKKEHGMLGKVNMGRSGVNMLWIIEEN